MTTYPGPTKTLSANYTVSGTQFAYADEDGDALEPEDIWRHGRATEEHTHDSARGLPVRRIETASAPSAPGHVQVLADDLRWWAAAAGAIRTALSKEGNAVVDGTWRFNLPLLLAAQLSAPSAPGVGLTYLYAKSDGRMYSRSGSGPEMGVGAPPTWNLQAQGWITDQVPGTNPELVRQAFTAPTWTLAYDAAATEVAYQGVRVPATYVPGLPLPISIAWSAPVSAGTVKWRCSFGRSGAMQPLAGAFDVSTDIVASYGGAAWAYQYCSGSITVPGLTAGDHLHMALARVGAEDDLAGDAFFIDGAVVFP